MLVGTKNIDIPNLKNACRSVQTLREYSDSLVPAYFSHIKEIVNNQRYLVAVAVRNVYKDDYNKWKPLCDGLLEGVRLTGGVTDLYSCSELLRACNVKVLKSFLEKEV